MITIGSITDSVFFLTIEKPNYFRGISFMRSYVGVVINFMIGTPTHYLQAHIRNPFFNYKKYKEAQLK